MSNNTPKESSITSDTDDSVLKTRGKRAKSEKSSAPKPVKNSRVKL